MLNYSPAQDEPPSADRPDTPTAATGGLSVVQVWRSIWRHKALVALSALAFGLFGVFLSKALPARYVASAQIYVDPRGLPGVDVDGAQGGDANGFVNYVESLSLIITSRSVLQRVVSSEGLTRDGEFVGGLFGLPQDASSDAAVAEQETDSAIRALANHISVKRPERTYVIDLSVSSRDAAKSARIANATTQAFIEAQSAMRADAARRATDSLAARLQTLRARVAEAESKVEQYKEQNGLAGAQAGQLTEEQLAEMSRQLTVARTQTDAARSRYEQAIDLRKRGADIGAVAVGLNLATLTPLRAQQAEARQRVGDLTAELGPRHPLVKDAQARLREADEAVGAELARIIENYSFEYAKAKDYEGSLAGQLERLKKQTFTNGRALIGLRDVEREAEAARKDFDLFETRSRQTGDIQQVDAALPNIRIVSLAAIPLEPSSPPRASVMGAAGLIFGAAAGAAMAVMRDRRRSPQIASRAPRTGSPIARRRRNWFLRRPDGKSDSAADGSVKPASPPLAEIPLMIVGERAPLQRRPSPQRTSRIALAEIGLATIEEGGDVSELRQALEAIGIYAALRQGANGPRALGVVGPNDESLRSALAVNLALAASRDGFRVALIDAVAGGSALTAAVTATTGGRAGERGALHETYDKLLLVLPSLDRRFAQRLHPERTLRDLKSFRGRLDLILCDCPEGQDRGALAALAEVDDIVALEGYAPAAKSPSAVADAIAVRLRAKIRLIVRPEHGEETQGRLGERPAGASRPARPGGFPRRSASTRIGDPNDSRSRVGLRD
jgi:uncharacterized protein involved in exopolysaccharide biosynthesis/Mrp family chromosome partitioning ATPase